MSSPFPMTEPVSLEEAKVHLRVDGHDEDLLIESLISAARSYCEDEMGVQIGTTTVTAGELVQPIPATLRSAMLIMVGFLYHHRDSDAQEVPGAVSALLRLSPLYRRLGAA